MLLWGKVGCMSARPCLHDLTEKKRDRQNYTENDQVHEIIEQMIAE